MSNSTPSIPSRKISETLLEYASPATESLPDDVEPAELQELLEVAAAIWNAVQFADRGDEAPLIRMREDMVQPGVEAAVGRLLFEMMVERKRQEFADDPRMIGEISVRIGPDGDLKIRVEACLPSDEIRRAGLVTMPKSRGTASPGRAKVGRNDPCPCGSGRKHKKCCGAS